MTMVPPPDQPPPIAGPDGQPVTGQVQMFVVGGATVEAIALQQDIPGTNLTAGTPAVMFAFTDLAGAHLPVIVFPTNDDAIFVRLAEIVDNAADKAINLSIARDLQEATEKPADVKCTGCGIRIFHAAAERGICFVCKPETEEDE